ncbi:MAG: replicative DNA helicase [Candidatus Methylacidiphilales bacterium]
MISQVHAKSHRGRSQPLQINLEGLPPIHSPESESAILGAILAQPQSVLPLAIEALVPEDFFNPAHRTLFTALLDMDRMSTPIDLSSVLTYLKDRKLDEAIGGPAFLSDLATSVVSILTAPTHIKTVQDKATLRRLLDACARIAYEAHDRTHDVQGVVDEAANQIFAITDRKSSASVIDTKVALYHAIKLIEHLRNSRGKCSGIPSGFEDLDHLTGGFKPGEMIVLAARPGVGKTALALSMVASMLKERYDMASDAYVRPGYSVAFFSLEMTAEQLMLRLLALSGNIAMDKITKGKLTEAELLGLNHIGSELADMRLFIDESSMLTINQLRAKARRLRQDSQKKVDIIVIDYLQLLTSSSEKARDNRQVEVAEISRGIKALALELKIPIIVLAQLNRKPEESNQEPALHHLRESGSIEQDADVVMMLSAAQKNQSDDDKAPVPATRHGYAQEMILNLVKQRNGPTDRIGLIFQREYTRFTSKPRSGK